MTETQSNPVPTAIEIAQLCDAANVVEGYRHNYKQWIEFDLPTAWTTFITHALSQAGMKRSSRWEGKVAGFDYDHITLDSTGFRYFGEETRHGNYDCFEYVIPWGFVSAMNRDELEATILAQLRQEKIEQDAAAVETARTRAEAQHRAKVKQLEDLAASLGMKVTNA